MSRNEQFIDEHEIRKAISMLKPSGEHFEVRIIGQKRLSGYFGDAETLINALRNSVDLRSTNVYITLNELKDGVSQRTQFEHFKAELERSIRLLNESTANRIISKMSL